MKILIMRHGEAENAYGRYTDAQRPLTGAGLRQATAAAAELQAHTPVLMLVSPLLRTQQTADRVAAVLQPSVDREACDWLRSEADPQQALSALSEFDVECLLLISHMPLVSLLVEHLSGARVSFQTGSVGCVSVVAPDLSRGEFDWIC